MTACSNPGSSGSDVAARTTTSAPTIGVSARAGDVASPSRPTSSVAVSRCRLEDRGLGVVLEGRRAVAGPLGLGHPELHQLLATRGTGRHLLGVHDAVTGGHEVDLAGPEGLLAPEAVTMDELAVEHPGDRVQTGVRVRSHLHGAGGGVERAGVVDEAPGTDGPAGGPGKEPTHGDAPDVGLLAPDELGRCHARRPR